MDLAKVEADLAAANFDVEKHASNLLMAQSNASEISEYVACLSEAERRIDHKLEDHVALHYEDLLDQATSVERIEDQLAAVTAQSSSLMSSIEKVRNRVAEPCNSIRNQTVSLGRMQETCDILRRIVRILQLGKKLQQQLAGGSADITKAAQSISELTELWEPDQDLNLSNIQAIEGELKIFHHARKDVERSADIMLASGMETKNQNQIGVALQVYFNLDVLRAKIEQVIMNEIQNIKSSFEAALDARKINESINDKAITSGGISPSVHTSVSNIQMAGSVLPGFRTQLWNNVENVLDFIYTKTCELMQLQKVLCKKRDPSLGATFAELLNHTEGGKMQQLQVLSHFWQESLKAMKGSLMKGSTSSSSIRQSFEGEFPKLVKLFNDLWQRLSTATNTYLVSDPTITVPNPFHSESRKDVRDILTDFERVYLSRSLSRLFDPVNLMFATSKVVKRSLANSGADNSTSNNTGQAPSSNELDAVVREITSELSIACKVNDSNNRLWTAVAKNVAKTVRLMCNKCEESMVSGDDNEETSQVVGYPTDGQRKNVKVINCLNAFHHHITKIGDHQATLDNVEAKEIILASLKDIDKLSRSVIEPLRDSVKDAIEAIILTMHNENHFSSEDDVVVTKISPYLRELKTFLQRACNDFLQPFQCDQLISTCTMSLALKTIDLFVQHASMIRPIGRFGQRSIVYDCDQFESILEPLVELIQRGKNMEALDDIEKSLKQVTAFKTLVFTKPECVMDMEEILSGTLKYSIVLHFLFNKAPSELKSPNDSAGWSVSRYSAWLEDHAEEKERLQLIKGALESYAAGTKLRREKSYAAPYTIMVQILQSALDAN